MPHILLLIWAALVALQSFLLILVWGIGLSRFTKPQAEAAPGHPKASLIIPLTGRTPDMEASLHTFLAQDYPHLETILVTSGEADPAHGLSEELSGQYPETRHVSTGIATRCAQKNHNLLAGIEAASRDTSIYVFCDANHLGRSDMVRELVAPIIRNEADFTTSYREVELHGFEKEALALRLLVWSMGQFQSLPVFTQPWGGAMAISASAFQTHRVGDLWAVSVVDDCSLAGLLARKGISVRYCPGAMLRTPLRAMDPQALLDWFSRQLLYPKFFTRTVWMLVGLCLIYALALPAASLLLLLGGLTGALSSMGSMAMAVALCHLCLPFGLGVWLRRRLCAQCPPNIWWKGFLRALVVVYCAYWKTLGTTSLTWRGVRYEVDGQGKVTLIDRKDRH